ncbi:MAG: serine--tRNA ligase [bacterium]|nr:serine--tRNA ligase [bacterium]
MLDIRLIRENPEKIKTALKQKNVSGVDIDRLLHLDRNRRRLLNEVERWQSEQNRISDEIGKAKTRSDKDAVAALMAKAVDIKVEIQKLQPDLEFTQREYDALIVRVPNLPADDVPVGASEKDNVVMREVWFEQDAVRMREESYTVAEAEKKQFKPPWPHPVAPRDYMEIAEKLDWIDTERAGKVSGTRFGYLKREAALMEFALVELAFQLALREGFIPVVPPVLVRPETMRGMGYVERGGDEIYYLPVDDMYLVGTSEQSVGPMHGNEIFQPEDLPRRYIAFSPCFRREAGSYGKDTKGILRVHQFDKVEMLVYALPDNSSEEHGRLLAIEEQLMQVLRLPYRVLRIASADLGDPAAAKFDIEAWLPGQGEYRETHSTSNTTDFQARRLGVKYRTKRGETAFVHMLNGTAVAIGRTLIAIIENYQQPDGTVAIPAALKPFMP